MRRIKEILRLKWSCGLGDRAVAHACSVSRSTVSKYVRRAREVGLSWPLPEGLMEEELERRLFPVDLPEGNGPRFIPDWAEIRQQLAKKGVTLRLASFGRPPGSAGVAVEV